MNYKILWIDDEHMQMFFFKMLAEQNNIDLICETNVEDGVATFQKMIDELCAIILDIRCPLTHDSHENPDTTANVTSALVRFIGLNKNHVPIYIFSGAGPDYLKKIKSDWCHENIKAYDKSSDGDGMAMLNDIRDSIESMPQNKIRQQHSAIFNSSFLSNSTKILLGELIKPTNINTLRIIGENAFADIAKRLQLIAPNTPHDQIPINKSSQKIAECPEDVVPVYVSQSCTYVARIGNSASHKQDYTDVNYLYDSVLQALLVVLNWAATELRTEENTLALVDSISDFKKSRPQINWAEEIKRPEDLKGKHLSLKGKFVGDYYKLIPRKGQELANGMTIEVIDAQWDTETEAYSFFIKNYKIIDRG